MGYLVQSFLDDSRRRSETSVAIRCLGRSITFDELYRSANRLANCLKQQNVERQGRVCICLKRSAHVITAIMGILKADAVYVPIDPKSPDSRWRRIIADCRPAAIICEAASMSRVSSVLSSLEIHAAIVILGSMSGIPESLEKDWVHPNLLPHSSEACPAYRNIDTDIAYILYTSGSTGTPKGVMVSHLNIRNYIDWAIDCFGLSEKDKILGTAPFHFDMSTFDIHCALKSGACLVIASDFDLLFPEKLVQLMESEAVTLWKGISSLFIYLAKARAIAPGRMPLLRQALFSGEVLPTAVLIKWMQTFPEKRFFNVYGPTEATGISAFYPVETIPEDGGVSIPIGKACANTEIILLSPEDTVVSDGDPGEICIRGAGVSMGYWRDPEKTRSAFVANPLTNCEADRIYRTGDMGVRDRTGNILFTGRKDHQVKYMGYRIELAEIERNMTAIAGVHAAAALLSTKRDADMPELAAYYECDAALDVSSVYSELSGRLPQYMMPRRLIPVERLPRNDRGKLDRTALRQLEAN